MQVNTDSKSRISACNTYPVFDWLWTSGQLSERDILRLPTFEIDAVINLALPGSANALAGEAEFVTRLGLSYIHIPVEWEQPEQFQLRQFFGVLKALEGRKVWVHCAKNMRVSAFIYLYRRLLLNEDEATARHPMQEIWEPNEIWQSFIDEALAMHASDGFA